MLLKSSALEDMLNSRLVGVKDKESRIKNILSGLEKTKENLRELRSKGLDEEYKGIQTFKKSLNKFLEDKKLTKKNISDIDKYLNYFLQFGSPELKDLKNKERETSIALNRFNSVRLQILSLEDRKAKYEKEINDIDITLSKILSPSDRKKFDSFVAEQEEEFSESDEVKRLVASLDANEQDSNTALKFQKLKKDTKKKIKRVEKEIQAEGKKIDTSEEKKLKSKLKDIQEQIKNEQKGELVEKVRQSREFLSLLSSPALLGQPTNTKNRSFTYLRELIKAKKDNNFVNEEYFMDKLDEEKFFTKSNLLNIVKYVNETGKERGKIRLDKELKTILDDDGELVLEIINESNLQVIAFVKDDKAYTELRDLLSTSQLDYLKNVLEAIENPSAMFPLLMSGEKWERLMTSNFYELSADILDFYEDLEDIKDEELRRKKIKQASKLTSPISLKDSILAWEFMWSILTENKVNLKDNFVQPIIDLDLGLEGKSKVEKKEIEIPKPKFLTSENVKTRLNLLNRKVNEFERKIPKLVPKDLLSTLRQNKKIIEFREQISKLSSEVSKLENKLKNEENKEEKIKINIKIRTVKEEIREIKKEMTEEINAIHQSVKSGLDKKLAQRKKYLERNKEEMKEIEELFSESEKQFANDYETYFLPVKNRYEDIKQKLQTKTTREVPKSKIKEISQKVGEKAIREGKDVEIDVGDLKNILGIE